MPQGLASQQLAAILGALPDACYVFDRDGRCIYGNSAAERFLAAGRERLLGALVWDILPDADGGLHDLHLRAMINRHPLASAIYAPWLGEWFDVAMQPMDGGLLVVTARRCLGEQEPRPPQGPPPGMAAPIDGAGRDVFWLIDAHGHQIRYVSPSYDKIWGRSHYPLYHSPGHWLQAVHADDLERVRQAYARGLEIGLYDLEYRIVRPGGELRWIHDRAYRVAGRAASADVLLRVAEDVTAQKRMAAARVPSSRFTEGRSAAESGQLSALRQSLTTLDAASSPSEVLDALLGVAHSGLGAYAGALFVPQGDPPMLTEHRTQGGFAELWLTHQTPAAPHPLIEALRDRQPHFYAPGEWAELFPRLYERCGAHVGSWLAAPVLLRGQLVAVLGLAFTYGREPGQADMDYLDMLVQQGCHALERVRLHRDAHEAISQSDAAWARLESLVHTVPVGLAIWDADLRYVHINPALAALNELSVEKHLGHTVHEMFPALPQSIAATFQRVLSTGQPLLNMEMHGFFPSRPDGTWLLSLFPVRMANGAVAGVGAVVMDITERKRAEAMGALMTQMTGALTQALTPAAVTDVIIAHLDQAFPIRGIWVMLLSEDGEWLELERAHGYSAQAIARWRRIHRTSTMPAARTVAMAEPLWIDPPNAGVPSLAADGQPASGTLAAIPLVVNRQPIGCLCLRFTAVDCVAPDERALLYTLARYYAQALQRARLDEAERQARLDAEAAVDLRDQFLSVAAHELKTPLTSLLGTAQLLQRSLARRDDLGERDRWALQVIQDQSWRLHQMILTMLDISRIQEGQLAIVRAPVDLADLARRVLRELQLIQGPYVLQLHVADDAELVVDGDELRLEQVLQNLLQNAIKYSPSGGDIAVGLDQDGDYAQITVRDHGVGIPADALPHLFDRFYRAENIDRRKISGLGVGLYVVGEIVQQHGGEVLIDSAEGHGSTFTVRLPLRLARERAAAAG